MTEMVYEDRGGLRVALEGPVVIDGVLHRVAAGFVVCNRGLNSRAWNFTMFERACPNCYPTAVECTRREYVQAEFPL